LGFAVAQHSGRVRDHAHHASSRYPKLEMVHPRGHPEPAAGQKLPRNEPQRPKGFEHSRTPRVRACHEKVRGSSPRAGSGKPAFCVRSEKLRCRRTNSRICSRRRPAVDGPVKIPEQVYDRVRALCLALPEVNVRVDESRVSTRSAAWSFDIRRRSFCLLVAVKGRDGKPLSRLVLHVDPRDREALVAIGHPYFVPRAGHRHRDRLGVWLTDETDWEEIRELTTESYRLLAPKSSPRYLTDNEPPSRARETPLSLHEPRGLPGDSSSMTGWLTAAATTESPGAATKQLRKSEPANATSSRSSTANVRA
jgi:hypothetical protein